MNRRLARYYADGSRKVMYEKQLHPNLFDGATVEEWIETNKHARFGNALFVDGVMVYDGNGIIKYHSEAALIGYGNLERKELGLA